MDDRELLEMAAKAAGLIDDATSDDNSFGLHKSEHGQIYITDPNGWRDWDPLTDDGDALRLAVKLRIDLDFDDTNPIVEAYRKELETSSFCACEALSPDADAATRRAIVRAAAELGKQS